MLTRALAAVVVLFSSAVAGQSSAAHHRGTTEVSIVAHPINLEFLTSTGASSPFPTGPLAPGDRVLGRDDILQAASLVGSDEEVCTVTFDRQVLCDDVVSFTGKGDLHVTWAYQWPASGTTGPQSFDGVVDGGTSAYAGAQGDFQATALTGRDLHITATITQR
jgi:hypothetical protein